MNTDQTTVAPTPPDTAESLVWRTWHHVPFDNAAITNAVTALHRDPLTIAAPDLLAALHEIVADSRFVRLHTAQQTRVLEAIAKTEGRAQ